MEKKVTKEPLQPGDEWNRVRTCYICRSKENLMILTIKNEEELKQYCICEECDKLTTL